MTKWPSYRSVGALNGIIGIQSSFAFYLPVRGDPFRQRGEVFRRSGSGTAKDGGGPPSSLMEILICCSELTRHGIALERDTEKTRATVINGNGVSQNLHRIKAATFLPPPGGAFQ